MTTIGYQDLANRLNNADIADSQEDQQVDLTSLGAEAALFEGVSGTCAERKHLIEDFDALDGRVDGVVSLDDVDAGFRDYLQSKVAAPTMVAETDMDALESVLAGAAQGKALDASQGRETIQRLRDRHAHRGSGGVDLPPAFVQKLSAAERAERDLPTQMSLVIDRVDLDVTDFESVPGVIEDAKLVKAMQKQATRPPYVGGVAERRLDALGARADEVLEQVARVETLHADLTTAMQATMKPHIDSGLFLSDEIPKRYHSSPQNVFRLRAGANDWQAADSVMFESLVDYRVANSAGAIASEKKLAAATADRHAFLEHAKSELTSAWHRAESGSLEIFLLQETFTYVPHADTGRPEQSLLSVVDAAKVTKEAYGD